MSIRDQGYQRYTGARTKPSARWRVVLSQSFRMTMKQPWVIALLCIALMWTIGWGVALFIKFQLFAPMQAQLANATPEQLANVPPQVKSLSQDPALYTYEILVSWGGMPIFAFLIAMFAGGGAIADDIRQNAFQFYFARPLSKDQYLVGKVLPAVIAVFITVFGASLLMAIVRLALYRSGVDSLGSLLALPLKAVVLATLEAVVLAVPAVALSSLSSRRGLVQGGYAALFLLPWILGGIIGLMTRSAWASILSVPAQLEAVGTRLFAYPVAEGDRVLPMWPALVVMALVVTGSIVLLRQRLASVEVVQG